MCGPGLVHRLFVTEGDHAGCRRVSTQCRSERENPVVYGVAMHERLHGTVRKAEHLRVKKIRRRTKYVRTNDRHETRKQVSTNGRENEAKQRRKDERPTQSISVDTSSPSSYKTPSPPPSPPPRLALPFHITHERPSETDNTQLYCRYFYKGRQHINPATLSIFEVFCWPPHQRQMLCRRR